MHTTGSEGADTTEAADADGYALGDAGDQGADSAPAGAAQNGLLSDAWHDAGQLMNEAYQGLKLLVGLPSESDDGTKTVFHWDGTWTTTYPDGRVRSDDGHGHEIPTAP